MNTLMNIWITIYLSCPVITILMNAFTWINAKHWNIYFTFLSTYTHNDDNKRVYSVFPALHVLPRYVCIFFCIRTRNPIPLTNLLLCLSPVFVIYFRLLWDISLIIFWVSLTLSFLGKLHTVKLSNAETLGVRKESLHRLWIYFGCGWAFQKLTFLFLLLLLLTAFSLLT